MTKGITDLVREARGVIREIKAAELQQWRSTRPDLLVVDVREINEYEAGHIPAALHVPRGLLEGAADPGFKHRVQPLCEAYSRPVVLYCQTGGRSALATRTLQEMGFTEVASLVGGFEVWEADDHDVASGTL